MDHNGLFEILLKLAEPSIRVEQIGKLSEQIISYMISEKSLVDRDVHEKLKKIKQGEQSEKRKKALEKRKRQ